MRLAIFADIHGKMLLPFKLVDLYQRTTGQKIDLILQCGDMGAYPLLERLDKATIKHAKYNRDELGFHDQFTKKDPQIEAYLDELNLQMICVRGNHEDHEYLDELEIKYANESRFPIDVYERIWLCKTGWEQHLVLDSIPFSFVGIGRIGDRKGRSDARFIQDYERRILKKLQKTKDDFDVLITHDKDAGSQRGYGMQEIRNLLDQVIFKYHFFGHTGEPFYQEQDHNGITQSVKIKELEFGESGILPKNCFVILEKNEDNEVSIKTVDQKITNVLTAHYWKDWE